MRAALASEDAEEATKESLRRKWAQLEAMVGTEKRIALVAEDLVKHWEARYAAMEGKAMVVCMSRRIWLRQITNPRGFERIYVAALRSAGIPARLNAAGQAELWPEKGWKPAPRPLIEIARD